MLWIMWKYYNNMKINTLFSAAATFPAVSHCCLHSRGVKPWNLPVSHTKSHRVLFAVIKETRNDTAPSYLPLWKRCWKTPQASAHQFNHLLCEKNLSHQLKAQMSLRCELTQLWKLSNFAFLFKLAKNRKPWKTPAFSGTVNLKKVRQLQLRLAWSKTLASKEHHFGEMVYWKV